MTVSKYIQIFLVLAVLIAITIIQPLFFKVATKDFMIFQLVMAAIKTYIIVMFYMHIKYETKITKYSLVGILFTISIVFIIVLIDTHYRELFLQFFGRIK